MSLGVTMAALFFKFYFMYLVEGRKFIWINPGKAEGKWIGMSDAGFTPDYQYELVKSTWDKLDSEGKAIFEPELGKVFDPADFDMILPKRVRPYSFVLDRYFVRGKDGKIYYNGDFHVRL